MSTVKERALQYISMGFSIVPIRKGGKAPAVKWEDFQKKQPTEEEIDSWIEWIGDDINLGIVTGKVSNLIVVDVDKNKITGELGDVSDLPPTTEAITGSGGRHLYYRYPEGEEVSNSAGIRPNVDIRAEGGQVVAPGSIHSNGNEYKWKLPMQPVAVFPIDKFKEKPRPQQQQDKGVASRDWSLTEGGVSEGGRNHAAASYAGKIQRTLQPHDHEVMGWPIFKEWNNKNNPPLSERELRTTWESIQRLSASDVRYDPNQARPEHTPVKIKKPEIVSSVEKVTWSEALELGLTELGNTKEGDCMSYGYDFLDEVLTGIFPGELVVLGGSTGSGKTTMAMKICHNVAESGKKVFVFALEDRIEDYAMKAVFYKINMYAAEDEDSAYSWNLFRRNLYTNDKYEERIKRAKEEIGNDNIQFIKITERLNFATLKKVIDEETKLGTELFLIDHLHYFDLDGGGMNRANYIENFMVDMRTMQAQNKARIILICHYRKLNSDLPTLDSFKDSSSIVQNANYVINLFRDRGESISTAKKKSSDTLLKALDQMKEQSQSRYVDTHIIIPKARNPNGESTIIVKYDKLKGEYIDKITTELRPLSEMGVTPTNPVIPETGTQEDMVNVEDWNW